MSATPPVSPIKRAPRPRGASGVKARPFPDWFAEDACVAAFSFGASVGVFPAMYLFNNDGQLRDYRIYALHVQSQTANQNARIFFRPSIANLTFAFPCVPIDPTGPAPTGQVFTSAFGIPFAASLWQMPAGPTGYDWPHDFPFCIVGAGGVLGINGDTSGADMEMFIWFAPVPIED